MKNYVATANFWRNGNLVEAGTELALSDREAKYIRHALAEKRAEPAPEPASAPAPEAVEAPAEAPVEPVKPRGRAKVAHGDE